MYLRGLSLIDDGPETLEKSLGRAYVNVKYIHMRPSMTLAAKLDDLGNPAWIALVVVGFIIWWPLGLVALGYLVGSGRLARWTGCGARRWQQQAQGNAGGWWGMPVSLERQPCLRRVPCRDTAPARGRTARIQGISRPPASCQRTRPNSTSSWPSAVVALKTRRRSRRTDAGRARRDPAVNKRGGLEPADG